LFVDPRRRLRTFENCIAARHQRSRDG
jgi:hypothetical protein